jgi:ketosteroid isomerase-like protein
MDERNRIRDASSRRHDLGDHRQVGRLQEVPEHPSVRRRGAAPVRCALQRRDRFRPVTIRAVYDDEEQSTVIVVWDGRGTTTAGTVYENTYVWIMTLSGGKVVDGTAFYDSIAFNELWETVTP